jgi:uncharacterized protein (TIGR02453 family)
MHSTIANPTGSPHHPVRFAGFGPGALEFLAGLDGPDPGSWLVAHRADWERQLLAPARDLVRDLGPLLQRAVAPGLRAEPVVGGSILRLQRDARFAARAPYRSHLEIWFWDGPGGSREHPGLFLKLTATTLALGGGIRTFGPARLGVYRRAVDDPVSGLSLSRALADLSARAWTIRGAKLLRPPAGFDASHERGPLLRHTGLWAETEGPVPEEAFTADLVRLVAGRLRRLKALHLWLKERD